MSVALSLSIGLIVLLQLVADEFDPPLASGETVYDAPPIIRQRAKALVQLLLLQTPIDHCASVRRSNRAPSGVRTSMTTMSSCAAAVAMLM